MNASGIILWSVLLGASFVLVNDVGVFAYQLTSPGAPTVQTILPAANCQVTAAGLPYNCTNGLGVTNDIVSTVFTFGDFFWSFVKAFPIMIEGSLVPGSVAGAYFGSGIGVVVNAGMFTLIAFWAWEVIGNRNFKPE